MKIRDLSRLIRNSRGVPAPLFCLAAFASVAVLLVVHHVSAAQTPDHFASCDADQLAPNALECRPHF